MRCEQAGPNIPYSVVAPVDRLTLEKEEGMPETPPEYQGQVMWSDGEGSSSTGPYPPAHAWNYVELQGGVQAVLKSAEKAMEPVSEAERIALEARKTYWQLAADK